MTSLAPSQFPSTGTPFRHSLSSPALPTFGKRRSSMPVRRPSTLPKRVLCREDYDQFLPMIRRIAMRLARRVPPSVSVDDLMSAGWVGLAEAFSRTVPSMPIDELEAYASHRVKGAMLDYLRTLDPSARQVRNASRRITRAVAKATVDLGRAPEEIDIAQALSLTVEGYRDLLTSVSRGGMTRLEVVDIDQIEAEISDRASTAPDEEAERHILAGRVAGAIGELPERLQKVLMLYYQESCTLKEIGSLLGVTESRVSQLHTEAMHRLRASVGTE